MDTAITLHLATLLHHHHHPRHPRPNKHSMCTNHSPTFPLFVCPLNSRSTQSCLFHFFLSPPVTATHTMHNFCLLAYPVQAIPAMNSAAPRPATNQDDRGFTEKDIRHYTLLCSNITYVGTTTPRRAFEIRLSDCLLYRLNMLLRVFGCSRGLSNGEKREQFEGKSTVLIAFVNLY